MRHLTDWIIATRLWLLAFLLPPLLDWTGVTAPALPGLFGWTGVWFALAVVGIVLFRLARFDAATLAAGERPRLNLSRDRAAYSPTVLDRWSILVGGVALVSVAALLVVQFALGLALLVLSAVWLVLNGPVRAGRRRRLTTAEFFWPLAILVVPYVVGLAFAPEADSFVPLPTELMPLAVHALSLAVFVFACLLRDAPEDAALGLNTVATKLGPLGARIELFLVLVALLIFATPMGAAVPAGVMAMLVLWLHAEDVDDAVPFVVLLGQIAIAMA